jgi:hypothetical protein
LLAAEHTKAGQERYSLLRFRSRRSIFGFWPSRMNMTEIFGAHFSVCHFSVSLLLSGAVRSPLSRSILAAPPALTSCFYKDAGRKMAGKKLEAGFFAPF